MRPQKNNTVTPPSLSVRMLAALTFLSVRMNVVLPFLSAFCPLSLPSSTILPFHPALHLQTPADFPRPPCLAMHLTVSCARRWNVGPRLLFLLFLRFANHY